MTAAVRARAHFRNAGGCATRIGQHGQTSCSLREAAATLTLAAVAPVHGQGKPALPPLPAPLGVPAPAPGHRCAVRAAADRAGRHRGAAVSARLAVAEGGRVREAETYNMSQSVPGRIGSIVNIHNPSIEFHTGRSRHQHRGGGDPGRRRRPQHAQRRHRERRLRAVLLQLRRQHGDPAQPPAQGRLRRRRRRGQRRAAGDPPGARARRGARTSIRTRSASWASRPAPSCRRRRRCSTTSSTRSTPIRPIRWPACRRGRTSSASSIRGRRRSRRTASRRRFPRTCRRRSSPAAARAIAATRSGRWTTSPRCCSSACRTSRCTCTATAGIPGDALPDGSRQSGGLTDRGDIPLGTWQARFVDWFRDLGFLQKPGVETKAAKDVATFVAQPPRRRRAESRRRCSGFDAAVGVAAGAAGGTRRSYFGRAGAGGAVFSCVIASAMARSSCGSTPLASSVGFSSTRMSGSTPYAFGEPLPAHVVHPERRHREAAAVDQLRRAARGR